MEKIIKNIDDWEILTPHGFKSFSGIQKIVKNKYLILMIEHTLGTIELKCSENHLIKTKNGKFERAKNLNINELLFNGEIVKNISHINDTVDLYDLLNVLDSHEYYTNGIISHNCAFIDNAEDIWGAAQQTLATGGKAIVLSTPNGVGNFFHKLWASSEAGENSFNTIQLHWSMHPERNQLWRDEQNSILGPRLAAQECDAEFLTSGKTVLYPETLKFYT